MGLFIDHLWSGMGKDITACYQENINGLTGIWALAEAASLASTIEVIRECQGLSTH